MSDKDDELITICADCASPGKVDAFILQGYTGSCKACGGRTRAIYKSEFAAVQNQIRMGNRHGPGWE